MQVDETADAPAGELGTPDEDALARARFAVLEAELGAPRTLELEAPPRPVLARLLDDGAADRVLLLLERGGAHGRVSLRPRRFKGPARAVELLIEDHIRLDALAAGLGRIAQDDPDALGVAAGLVAEGIRRHMAMEEALLFPRYVAAGGAHVSESVAQMRREHRAIQHYLGLVVAAAARLAALRTDEALEHFTRNHAGLAAVVDEHDAREERVLLPRLDLSFEEEASLVRQVVLF